MINKVKLFIGWVKKTFLTIQYEYLFLVSTGDKICTNICGSNEVKHHDDIGAVFCEAGISRWELVSDTLSSEGTVYIFKRPRR